MNKFKVTLLRDQLSTVITNNSIGVDAFSAVSSIPLCMNVTLIYESEDFAEIEYEYPKDAQKFNEINTHLAKFGLKKA